MFRIYNYLFLVHFDHRPQSRSFTWVSESSSGVEIIDEESMETHSSDSEPLIIRYDSPSSSSSPSLYSRQVIIKSTDKSPRRRRRFRRKQRKTFSFEKESISQQQSSQFEHHHVSPEQWNRKEDRLKHLFDKYSSEDVHREWTPLTFLESRQLYQYAYDKYHKKR